MNLVKEVLNIEEASCRDINILELQQLLKHNINIYWSWGSRNPTVDDMNRPKMYRIRVSGRHHKGYVYIFLNSNDLFDVYLTNLKNVIKMRTDEMGMYFDQVVEWIDDRVERIPEYID